MEPILIEATDEKRALKIASERGMLVEKIEVVIGPPIPYHPEPAEPETRYPAISRLAWIYRFVALLYMIFTFILVFPIGAYGGIGAAVVAVIVGVVGVISLVAIAEVLELMVDVEATLRQIRDRLD